MRIGLALSSGGAATMAEIGVLEALEARGIPVACAVGTSGGAVVGAAFCAGGLGGFRDAMAALTWRRVVRLFDPTWPRLGMLEGRRALEYVRPHLGGRVEELPLPYAAVATDLDSGVEVAITEGDVFDAVRASTAVPGVLTPWLHRGRMLVDGGIANPIPVSVAREMGADFVIAVNVLPLAERVLALHRGTGRSGRRLVSSMLGLLPSSRTRAPLPRAEASHQTPLSGRERRNVVDVLLRSGHVASCQIAAMRLRDEPADFLITVPVPQVGLFDFHRTGELVALGRRTAETLLPELEATLGRATPVSARVRRWLAASGLPGVAASRSESETTEDREGTHG